MTGGYQPEPLPEGSRLKPPPAAKRSGEPSAEAVNHPGHYRAGGLEAIDVIEAYELDFNLGNVLKYLLRAGRKPGSDPVEDLEKARWYLDRAIQRRKA